MPRIAWLGLGNMGRGMSFNLASKGSFDGPLILYNRTRARADEVAAQLPSGQARVVDSIREAVKYADIIYSIMSTDQVVKEVFVTALEEDVTGKLFVDCSTIGPETVDEIVAKVEAKNAGFVASQIFGPPAMAENGQLVIVLAGKADLIAKVESYTTGVMGKGLLKFPNEAPSKGPLMKLVGNTFIMNMVESIAQGLVLAEVTGVGGDHTREFLSQIFGGLYVAYADRMLQGSYYKKPPLMSVDNSIKDCGHALDLATKAGAKLPGMEIAMNHLEQAKQKQGGQVGDLASIYGSVRTESGLSYHSSGTDA